MITRLTGAEEARLARVREEWIAVGRSTDTDRAGAERWVRRAYRRAGLVPPGLVVWLASPYAGCGGSAMLAPVGAPVRAQVVNQVEAQVGAQVWNQVGEQVWNQVWAQGGAQIWDQIHVSVWAPVRAQVGEQVLDQVGYGTMDAAWLSFYAYFRPRLPRATAALVPLLELSRRCGWWWPFERAVILTDKPVAVHVDEAGRLHHEAGPAVAYGDGFGVHAWHGVRVPAGVIEAPERITLAGVLGEGNQEVRRVMLERYGWGRVLGELGAREVAADGYGRLVETDRLGEYLAGEDAVARFVLVRCPSTGRRYALRVPPGVGTARAAVAWTFGVAAGAYAPVWES